MMSNGRVQGLRRACSNEVLVVNKATGEVVREITVERAMRLRDVSCSRGRFLSWLATRPMTSGMCVLRLKEGFDPREMWDCRTENHPILVYDLVTHRSVMVPCTPTACSYLHASESTIYRALRGGSCISSRYVCLPLRWMGQYNGVTRRELHAMAVRHLYASSASG